MVFKSLADRKVVYQEDKVSKRDRLWGQESQSEESVVGPEGCQRQHE